MVRAVPAGHAEGALERRTADLPVITGLTGTSAVTQGHDHEDLIVPSRPKPFMTPKPFTKNAVLLRAGE
jgi:hypothetical protein